MQSMAQLNTTVDISLEVLSPLHIGTASEKLWKQNFDFIYNGDEVTILDPTKLIRALMGTSTDDGTPGIQAFEKRLAAGRNWDLVSFLDECDIDPLDIQLASYPVEVEPAAEIRPLIRTGYGETIIPGSSIKGAIRSVLFHHLYQQNNVHEKYAEKELFGTIGNNLMKYIRPFDAVCTETTITNSELFNLYQQYGNWESDYKPGFIVSTESFARGASAQFRLSIADGLYRKLKEVEGQSRKDLTPTYAGQVVDKQDPVGHLFQLINNYTRTHLERELAFFKRYNQAEDIEYLISNLEDYLQMTQSEQHCVLRLAYGSGFHAITGDWRFSDHTQTIRNPDMKNRVYSPSSRQREPARYKSRKVTGLDRDATLMGFVKLSK